MKEIQWIKKNLSTINIIALALFIIGWLGGKIWEQPILHHVKMVGIWMILGLILYKLIYWKTYKNENKSNLILLIILVIIVLAWLII